MLLLSLVTALIWAAAWANIVVHCRWSRLLCGFAQVPCAFVVSLQLCFQVGVCTCRLYIHSSQRSLSPAGKGPVRTYGTLLALHRAESLLGKVWVLLECLVY